MGVYKNQLEFMKNTYHPTTPTSVKIIVGKTGIVDSDIKHQLKEALRFYNFQFVRINLSFWGRINKGISGTR
jgi:exodeoxyribonuclease VII large subunit